MEASAACEQLQKAKKVAQFFHLVNAFFSCPKVLAIGSTQKHALANQVAGVPFLHPPLAERLTTYIIDCMEEEKAAADKAAAEKAAAEKTPTDKKEEPASPVRKATDSSVTKGEGTPPPPASSLNALYLLETFTELVPKFGDLVATDLLHHAAVHCQSAHSRVQAAILHGQRPSEWEKASQACGEWLEQQMRVIFGPRKKLFPSGSRRGPSKEAVSEDEFHKKQRTAKLLLDLEFKPAPARPTHLPQGGLWAEKGDQEILAMIKNARANPEGGGWRQILSQRTPKARGDKAGGLLPGQNDEPQQAGNAEKGDGARSFGEAAPEELLKWGVHPAAMPFVGSKPEDTEGILP